MKYEIPSFIKYLLVIILCIAFGIFAGELVVIYQIDVLMSTLSLPNVICFIGIFLLALLLAITLHELSHAVYFAVHKIPLRLVAVFIFFFYKDKGKWRFTLFPNPITQSGGIAIPDLPCIGSEEDLHALQRIYSRDLAFAPIVSGVLGLASLAVCALFTSFTPSMETFLFLKAFFVFSCLIGLILFFSSFIKIGNILGDFPAYRMFKCNDQLAALHLCQYTFFCDGWERRVLESQWLIDQMVRYAEQVTPSSVNMLDIRTLDWVIQMEYAGVIRLSEQVLSVLQNILNLDQDFFLLPQTEDRDIFYCHILYVLRKHGKLSVANGVKLAEGASGQLFKNCPTRDYYLKLTEHIMGRQNNKEWLLAHINPSSTYSLLKFFPAMTAIELEIINQRTN